MLKKLLLSLFFTVLLVTQINAQVTIFAEDFEAATGAENIASPYLGWQNGQFATTPPTNNNYFWIFDNTRSNIINGTYSMAVSINTPVTTAPFPEYRTTRNASTLVYHTTPIDATNHTNLTLDFNWICEGEAGFDYGTVIYSLDALTWSTLPGIYQGQSTVQNVTNLDLSVLDGQIFYLGFGWDNDSSFGNFPGFIVDDIDVKGTPLSTCIAPSNQPTVLNLAPTNNSILGTFTAAAPAPDNYLVLVSTSAVAPTPIDGTSYNIGDTIGTGTVVDIDANTSFTATGLAANTTYYIYVYSFNSLCSGGPIYNSTLPLTGTSTTTNSSYCVPLTQNNPSLLYIDDVQFLGTLNDVNNLTNGFSSTPSGYQDFTTSVTNSIQAQGQGINIYVGSNTARGHYKAWVDWDNSGTFGNLANELVYDSAGVLTATTTFGFVIPATQAIGDYRIRIRFNNAYRTSSGAELGSYNYTACEPFIFHNFPGPNNDYTDYGEAEDYLFTVVESCSAQITSITEASTCGPGSAILQVTGNASASDFNWYANETGGTPIATTSTFSPVISATTTYWVTASDGVCESLQRIPVTATFNPITALTITPENPIICGANDTIEIAATGSTELAYLIDEDFEGGGTGVFNVVNVYTNGAAQDAVTEWQNQTSTFVPNQQVWYPAISSGFGANQFVTATSDVNPISGIVWTALESPILDSSTFTDLTLNFDMYFSKYSVASTPDNIYIYISTDGGANFTVLQDINYDVGIGTNFDNVNIDLSAYINEPNLVISIDYVAGWMDGVAIDNVKVFGNRPLNPSFTWTGTVDAYIDAAATTPYVAGTPAASVFVKPTLAQLALGDFTFTANGSLSNGCTISKDITIINDSKIWNGSVSSDWNVAANWTPSGVPTSDNCVIINNTGPGTDSNVGPPLPPIPAFAKNVTVKNDAILELGDGISLTITDWLNVEPTGLLYMKNNSSLIQVNDVANTGDIFMERAPANGGAINNLNYVYWSSPVETFNVGNISPGSGAGKKWKWDPTTGSIYGNWIDASSDLMTDGQGYIVRGLAGVVANPSVALTANSTLFSGVPNNGDITREIEHGGYNGGDYLGFNGVTATNDDDNWNLIGNPYPSALWADSFLERNAASSIPNNDYNNLGLSPNQKIVGTIWLWQHGGIPAATNGDPFYDNFGSNYDPNQYIAYNFMGSTTGTFNGFIASGQAFFVLADHFNAALSGDDVLFHNGMRDATFGNNNFLRSATIDNTTQINRHRIWLNLVDSEYKAQAILVGYDQNATNERDNLYDGPQFTGSSFSFYSLIDNDRFAIQGRTLPFTDEDTIPLGFVTPQNDIYFISINQVDGLFEDETQDIYLEDTYTNTIHNLRTSPYSFTTEAGTFNDRFILRYTASALSIDDVDILNGIKVFEENDVLVVTSNHETIQSIEVYDILGRNLFTDTSINLNRFSISAISPSHSTLFLKIKLVDGKQKIAKVIF